MVALLRVITMALYAILPSSPFRELADSLEGFEFLPWLNWFIPFDNCLKFTLLWCAALAVVYNFNFIKNLINRIKDKVFGG